MRRARGAAVRSVRLAKSREERYEATLWLALIECDQGHHAAELQDVRREQKEVADLLKTCLYENYKPMAGRERPTRLVMQNALLQDEESVLEYSGMRLRDLPDRMFTKDYLKRLE